MVISGFLRVVAIGIFLLINACFVTYFFYDQNQESIPLDDNLRAKAPGKFVELQFGPVHYMLRGDDSSPLLVFIHGGGITGLEVWEESITFFTDKGYRILAFDLYGRGYSARPKVAHTPTLYLNQIIELLDALEITGRFDIISLSLGAIPGLDLYEVFPDRIRHLILIDPIAGGTFKPNSLLKVPLLSNFLMTAYWYPQAIESQKKEFVDHELFEDYAERLKFFQNIKGYKQTNYSTWMNVLQENKLPILKEIPVEKLMVIYGNQDPYFGKGQKKFFQQLYPSLNMVQIDQAGHMPQYEQPALVNEIIYKFIS